VTKRTARLSAYRWRADAPGARCTPRPYYGWVLACTLGVTETVSWGVLYYAFSVFVYPMEAELGWSRADLSGAFSLALLVSGLAAVPVGRWLDRHGPRALMTVGSCAGTLLVVAWAGVQDLLTFYAVWIGIGLVMASVLYEPAFTVLAKWFRRRRSQALTILTIMAALASTIFLPLAAWLVELQGWRAALVTLAIILGITTIPPHALLLRRRPEDVGQAVDGERRVQAEVDVSSRSVPEADSTGLQTPQAGIPLPLRAVLSQPTFIWLALAFCINGLCSVAVGVHLVPYLADRGVDARLAATIVGLIGLMQVAGRLAFAPLEPRLPKLALSAGIVLIQPLALTVLLLVPNAIGLCLFVGLFGAGRGAMTLARAYLVAHFYGASRYGTISGVLALLTTFAVTLGPIAAGAGYDLLGDYALPFWGIVILWGAGAGALLMAGRRAEAWEAHAS
jgi:MFS family permease